jgi:hypothetical protein
MKLMTAKTVFLDLAGTIVMPLKPASLARARVHSSFVGADLMAAAEWLLTRASP